MDSLQATYKDDEDDEYDFLPTTNAPAVATAEIKTSTSDDGFPDKSIAALSSKMEQTDLPPTTTSTGSDAPTEPVNGIKSEPDQSEVLSESEPASEDTDAKRSPKSIRPTENEDDDDDDEPPPKKKKQLSSITGGEEQETLPNANGRNGSSKAVVRVAATAMTAHTTPGSHSKKSKKKNNNVWVTKSTRKGKKKSKGNNNNNTPIENPVLITPVQRFPDKSDDTPDMKICLSKVYKAEKVELSEDRMSASSTKGYRMVRATRGVVQGAWYFEIKVVKLGKSGHTRMGWSTEKGDLQAPVGYDGNSFGYRDIDGSKVHKALREKYGEGYKEGDVIGFYINLPDGAAYAPKPSHMVWYKGQRYVCVPDAKEDPPKVVPGSEISFFKNGVWQGVAFTDLFGGRYYPSTSMYTLPNQPNCVVHFNFGPDFEFFPHDFGGRTLPSPMVEVSYHGFDNRAENGESNEKKS